MALFVVVLSTVLLIAALIWAVRNKGYRRWWAVDRLSPLEEVKKDFCTVADQLSKNEWYTVEGGAHVRLTALENGGYVAECVYNHVPWPPFRELAIPVTVVVVDTTLPDIPWWIVENVSVRIDGDKPFIVAAYTVQDGFVQRPDAMYNLMTLANLVLWVNRLRPLLRTDS